MAVRHAIAEGKPFRIVNICPAAIKTLYYIEYASDIEIIPRLQRELTSLGDFEDILLLLVLGKSVLVFLPIPAPSPGCSARWLSVPFPPWPKLCVKSAFK